MNRTLLIVWMACCFITAGCGGFRRPGYEVSGEVTYESEPVDGEIVFWPEDKNTPAAGGLLTEGKYTVIVPAGEYTVRIIGVRDIPGRTRPGPKGESIPIQEEYIPKEFNAESTLTASIPSDSKFPLNFELP